MSPFRSKHIFYLKQLIVIFKRIFAKFFINTLLPQLYLPALHNFLKILPSLSLFSITKKFFIPILHSPISLSDKECKEDWATLADRHLNTTNKLSNL